MKERLISTAVTDFKISVMEASIYINNYCEFNSYVLPENKIFCGLCNTENSAGSTTCKKCSKPLFAICPSCQTSNGNSAVKCAKCGFDLTQMDKAIELIRKAQQSMASKMVDEAERLVKEAKIYWPDHHEIIAIEKSIADYRQGLAKSSKLLPRI